MLNTVSLDPGRDLEEGIVPMLQVRKLSHRESNNIVRKC